MALSATANLRIHLTAAQVEDLDFGADVTDRMDESRGKAFTSGTGANNINVMWRDQRGIAAEATETLALHDGTLTNGLGNAVTMDALKAIYVKNTSTTLTLSIGGVATGVPLQSDPETITIDIPPGGELLMTAPNATGWDVTTNEDLKMTAEAGTGTLTYDIAVWGVDS